ncbi:hypothetical protein [Nitrospira sp. BLG_2]|uniref:hypothetical protein n=1 Tax=Nitrospira sp. BLG_2 TaxID=3397507 RepID=UPI003B9B70E4
MSITAKPTSYTVNTGHAKCPDHLWLFNEGTGTTVADEGKGTALDLTLDNSDMWGTDGSLGSIISANSAGPRKALSSTGTLASSSLVMVVLHKSASAVCAANEFPISAALSSAGGVYGGARYQTNEALDIVCDDGPNAVAAEFGTSTYDASWRMGAVKWKTNAYAVSVDGGAWVAGAGTVNYPPSPTALDRFGIGCRAVTAADNQFNGNILAAWVYDDLYDTVDDTWIADLFSDPWQFLSAAGTTISPNAAGMSV